jgi:HAD superfamily hydrolase (TIGR01490 family)
MEENKITLAIFDFDGTLTEGHFWVGISKHHRAKKVNRLALYTYLLSHLPPWFASKLKLYNEEKNRAKWGQDLSVLFKGFTVEEARRTFEWVTDNYFIPLLRPDVMGILKEHKKQGHKVMILSGMFTDFLEIMGRKIGADYVVGTKLEKVNSMCTGRIIKPLCFGENKARFLNEFVQQNQLKVDFSRSSAYADSIYDTPIFRLVGRPVATYPDKELYRLALSQKWQIVGHANILTVNHL